MKLARSFLPNDRPDLRRLIYESARMMAVRAEFAEYLKTFLKKGRRGPRDRSGNRRDGASRPDPLGSSQTRSS